MAVKRDLSADLKAVTAKINQLKGRESANLARLESEFGLDSLEQAEEALVASEKETAALEKELDEQYTQFEKQWGPTLDSLS